MYLEFIYIFSPALPCNFQAVYRGYWVRRRLCELLRDAMHVSDEENSIEEDINLNLIVEVSSFLTYNDMGTASFLLC